MTVLAPALDAYARLQRRVFADRSHTVGASDIGQCARKVWYFKNENGPNGAPRNPDFVENWGAAKRGTTFENHFAVPALRARYGNQLLYAGEQQRTFTFGPLSATPDGLIVCPQPGMLASLGVPDIGSDSLGIEIKTLDPRARLDGPRPEHVFQVQTQLGLIRIRTEHRPEYAVIAYVDASFWDLVVEFPVRRDPAVFKAARQRAAKILSATAAEQLPPEGWIAGADECRYCPFSHACGGERTRVPMQATEAPDPAFLTEVAGMAREIQRREAALDDATVALRTAQLDLKERLRARGFRRVVGDGVSITWSPVRGRPAWDDKAIREAAAAAGIDLAPFETVGDRTDRLTIRASTPNTVSNEPATVVQATEQSRPAA
jgi:hypothetical protein